MLRRYADMILNHVIALVIAIVLNGKGRTHARREMLIIAPVYCEGASREIKQLPVAIKAALQYAPTDRRFRRAESGAGFHCGDLRSFHRPFHSPVVVECLGVIVGALFTYVNYFIATVRNK